MLFSGVNGFVAVLWIHSGV
ncbi:hypothetical protein AKJ16_DCAP22579 [Drosera capensis]